MREILDIPLPQLDLPLPRDPETLMWIATIGGSITLLGVLMTLLIYLTRGWGRERTYAHAKVLALFSTDQDGQMVVLPAGLPPNALRYYVHLELPNGSVEEFECSSALYRQLLEGARGRAVCKGNFLLAFYPDTGCPHE